MKVEGKNENNQIFRPYSTNIMFLLTYKISLDSASCHFGIHKDEK